MGPTPALAGSGTPGFAPGAFADPERIVFRHGADADDPEAFQSTLILEERSGGTEVTLRSVFNTRSQRDRVVEEYRAIEGAEQTLGRLNGYIVTRVDDARQ